jgi:transposase, IS5 family
VPHPTTLVKLVRRAGPERIAQRNSALLDKLAQDKLLRGRKLRVGATVVEADIDDPTDAGLLADAVGRLGGLVRRVKARGAASQTRFRDRGRAAGRRMRKLGQTLRRRSGDAMAEVQRVTAELAGLARRHCARCSRCGATPAGRCGAAPRMGGLRGWSASWTRR